MPVLSHKKHSRTRLKFNFPQNNRQSHIASPQHTNRLRHSPHHSSKLQHKPRRTCRTSKRKRNSSRNPKLTHSSSHNCNNRLHCSSQPSHSNKDSFSRNQESQTLAKSRIRMSSPNPLNRLNSRKPISRKTRFRFLDSRRLSRTLHCRVEISQLASKNHRWCQLAIRRRAKSAISSRKISRITITSTNTWLKTRSFPENSLQ